MFFEFFFFLIVLKEELYSIDIMKLIVKFAKLKMWN